MSTVITGLFDNASQATLAIYRLEALGVSEADISIVANDSYTKEDLATMLISASLTPKASNL